ncbi:MAG TPA: CRTAC1 family protein, partial [Bacteroidetes bacterium]|nr:CRTAC1 family protein [Bacteroidota bacterium]
MMAIYYKWFALAVLFGLMSACSESGTLPDGGIDHVSGLDGQGHAGDARFRLLSTQASGISFVNSISESADLNYFQWMYMYNGGGVAVGDLNGDHLPDVYFSGNQVPNQLYLNLGNLKFREVSAIAGVAGSKWSTGVTMADVNGDGRLDIYVTRGGPFLENVWDRTNLLFLNNGVNADGVPTFTESAQQWQCNDAAFGTHASFFDYDLDGDLDLYVVNHPYQFGAKIDYRLARHFNPQDFESDRFFRNEGDHFTDITAECGIARFAFGLSGSVGDFNGDGYPDIYVANDFSEPDFMFINQRDGTFKDLIQEMVPHISNFGMGSDVADFNDDGLPDILVLDMMAENNRRKKTNMSGMDLDIFAKNVANGFHYQFMQNTLLMNQGNNGGRFLFSDVAQLAGISATDWSWAPLIADFDNDGRQDIFISNGYRRDTRDNDFVNRLKEVGEVEVMKNYQQSLAWMPEVKLANYMFRNLGDASGVPTFKNESGNWGLSQLTWSNGAAYADLDLDGDLDLLVNNLDERAFLYENRSQELEGKHWLRVELLGKGLNRHGVGAKVRIKLENGAQMWRQVMLSRGFQSSVEPILHFGLGEVRKVERLEIVWPDGKFQWLENVGVDQVLQVKYAPNGAGVKDDSNRLFVPVKRGLPTVAVKEGPCRCRRSCPGA